MKLDCRTSREHFSDYVDGELAPALGQIFAGHLDSCPACNRELHEFRAALAAVRNMEAEEPQPGLADRVLARIARESPPEPARAVPPTSPRRGNPAPVERFDRRRMRVALAAAALLLVVVGVQVGWAIRGSDSSDADIAELRTLVRELEDERDDNRIRSRQYVTEHIALDTRIRGLESDLQSTGNALAESRQDLARSRETLTASQRETERLGRELEELRLASLDHASAVTDLEQRLDDASAESKRLLNRLSEIARREREDDLPPDAPDTVISPDEAQPPSVYADPNSSPQDGSVVFRRERGGLSIEYSEPRPRAEIIDELIDIATHDDDAGRANLALSTLEHLIRLGASPEDRHRLDRLGSTSRRERLRTLEGLWKRQRWSGREDL